MDSMTSLWNWWANIYLFYKLTIKVTDDFFKDNYLSLILSIRISIRFNDFIALLQSINDEKGYNFRSHFIHKKLIVHENIIITDIKVSKYLICFVLFYAIHTKSNPIG